MSAYRDGAPGQRRSRRIRVVATALCAMTAMAAGARGADDSQSPAIVSVHEEHGVYSVNVRFRIQQSPAIALAVLTDYERIPRFMPDVESSTVLERGAGHAVIDQQGVSHYLMFRKRIHLVLEITERSDTLQFRDRSGSSFVRYEGLWRLCEDGEGTSVSYDLVAQPAFDVPEFMLKRLLQRDSARMIDGLCREIASRSSGARTK